MLSIKACYVDQKRSPEIELLLFDCNFIIEQERKSVPFSQNKSNKMVLGTMILAGGAASAGYFSWKYWTNKNANASNRLNAEEMKPSSKRNAVPYNQQASASIRRDLFVDGKKDRQIVYP